jgi:RHS repeat-associated protein
VHEVWREPAAKVAVENPFRLLGQSGDQETGLAYTRYRYFEAETGRWLSPDPIGLMGGKNLHGFDGAPSSASDELGLGCKKPKRNYAVYILVKDGKVVYYGITKQKPSVRRKQHSASGKDFDEMRVVDSGLTRREARNFEGSALHHANSGRGQYNGTLQNELRPTTPGDYHSYTDPPGKGKKLLTNSEVELNEDEGYAG